MGHNALGAGQIIDQGARLVDKAVQSGDIFKHDGWKKLKPAFEKNTLHFIGLLSDGGVHSRYDQLLLCLQGGCFLSEADSKATRQPLSAVASLSSAVGRRSWSWALQVVHGHWRWCGLDVCKRSGCRLSRVSCALRLPLDSE